MENDHLVTGMGRESSMRLEGYLSYGGASRYSDLSPMALEAPGKQILSC